MNQNDQMLREALREVLAYCDELGVELGSVRVFAEQALNHTPDTGKMVRLTEIELWRNDELMALNAEFGLLFPDVKRFANAIMDAMIKKNGGTS